MKLNSRLACSLGAILLSALSSHQLKADTVYTGVLANPAAVVQESFSLASAGDISLFTTSYGGGKNLDGTTTPAGGFQPNITLYKSDGTYVDSQWATPPASANTDPSTKLTLDSYLAESSLASGTYIVTLTNWNTQQPITATNLSDGFIAGSNNFNDVQGNTRTGAYALNISTPGAVSATPEPATFWLILPSLAGTAFLMRNRRRSLS
jgi:hypothetical protein